jgi:D-alanine-D-alanine ligase
VFDGGLTLVKAGGIAGRSQTQKIDIAFPSMHGTYGEDGSLMGLLDMSGIPYVGCGLASAALAMDKVLAKQIISASGLATCKFIYFSRRQIENDQQNSLKAIEKHLKYPLFVKPAHLGSSIGISRAANQTELLNALDLAAHYDDKILVEEEVVNLIEVTLPIMGNDDPKPALLERPMIKPEDFFDFDSKYMHGGKKGKGTKGSQGYSELPAKLPKDLYQKAEKLGVEVYKALNCSGTARVDMLIDNKTGTVYFNEVNPLPGSLYAHNWAKAGVSNVELVTKLIGYAEERWQSEQQLITSFDTNYLQQF